MRITALILALVVCLGTNALAWVQESSGNVSKILEPIRKVGKSGLGNIEAQKAWKQLGIRVQKVHLESNGLTKGLKK